MKRFLLAISLGTALLGGCASNAPAPSTQPAASAATPAASEDQRFTDLSARWLDGWLRASPVTATQTGDHRFDAELDDLDAAARARKITFNRGMLDELERIDLPALSRENQVDARILRNQLRYDLWNLQTRQDYALDPLIYTGLAGSAIYSLMARDFAPLPDRLRSATARMEKLPTLFLQMRANLDFKRVPRIFAETAAKQNNGVMDIVDELITPQATQLQGADRERLDRATTTLRAAVVDQQNWLDNTLVPNAHGDFRLGARLYDEKLAFALDSPLSRQEIRRRAEAELVRVRAQMYDVARSVLNARPGAKSWPEHPNPKQQQAVIEGALALANAERPARDTVVATAKKALADTTAFVREKDLITLPDSPVEIILMPEFQRGVALAYCDSPGPLDKGLTTFFAVSPIPDDWTPAQADSFLREYNTRSINELTVHEAMPGHYVQLAHSNQYPSTLRAVLSSGAFIEGWAVYAEKLMADEGYLDHDPLYQLVQLKWYLRTIANAILDQAIHVDGMTRDQAMHLMMVTTFQEEREAAGKWVRAQLSSAQLPTYFVGVQEHLDLRRDAQQRAGAAFNLKHYHDTVLSFGSPPVRYVRELMFDQPIE